MKMNEPEGQTVMVNVSEMAEKIISAIAAAQSVALLRHCDMKALQKRGFFNEAGQPTEKMLEDLHPTAVKIFEKMLPDIMEGVEMLTKAIVTGKSNLEDDEADVCDCASCTEARNSMSLLGGDISEFFSSFNRKPN
jgi:hypothetical protein